AQVDGVYGALNFAEWIFGKLASTLGWHHGAAEIQAVIEPRHTSTQNADKADLEPGAQTKRMEQHAPDPRHGGPKRIKGGQTVHKPSPQLACRVRPLALTRMLAFPAPFHKPFCCEVFCREHGGGWPRLIVAAGQR